MDIIELFEDISSRADESGVTEGPSEVEHALAAVLSEIDEIAKATFRSITLDTMLKLIQRQRRADTVETPN
jgi:hypothetical protein